MKSRDFFSVNSSLNSLGILNISSPEESLINLTNATTKYYEDRPSHRISQYSNNTEEDIFDIDQIKTYETPVDSIPTPKLNIKEIQNLKSKFQEFRNQSNTARAKDLSPRPIIKSPLQKKKSKDPINISPLTPIRVKPSYKKPLLTISINISGKEIIENVFQGDNSIEIAKRIFIQAGINGSQQGIKNLSDIIHKAISDYMEQVSLELLKFHKSSKKIQQEQVKLKLDKIKPPLLETERRAEEKRQILGSVNINIEGEEIVVAVREGDLADKLAEKICNERGLGKELFLVVRQPIKDFIDRNDKKFLFRLEFDLGGKIVEVAVYENDDLNAISQKFVRENKIGRENISKIEELLKKQMKALNI